MVWFVLIVLGLCLGSFVNALVWRLHIQQDSAKRSLSPFKSLQHWFKISGLKYQGNKQDNKYSILSGRSMCPDCHHELAPKDLIPLLSWILLRGKCRYCGHAISVQYPVVEALLVGLFVVSYAFWPLPFNGSGTFSFILWLIFLTAFLALAVYDLRWFQLPNKIIYPLVIIALIEVLVRTTFFGGGWASILTAIWGVLFVAGLFYVLYVASGGAWIGFGDVKLAIVLGLLVGGPSSALLLIFFASVMGSILAFPLLLTGKAKVTTQIPFGPFLLTSAVIIVLFGGQITDWYNRIFYLH